MENFEKKLKYKFNNTRLLETALTHRSFKDREHNERLEFLGDAVLGLIVGEYLFLEYPGFSEGELSKIRASMVNEKSFAKLANYLTLGDYLHLSSAEDSNHGRFKPSILSNAFEAVIGAIYLDSSLDRAREVVLDIIKTNFGKLNPKDLIEDYKTALQEETQALFGVTPEYIVISELGPDHKKMFEVELLIDKKSFARGIGNSKKQAQQEAAKVALKRLQEAKQ